MLDPDKSRFDYGEHLQPPEGYELDSAIATTYSLDLDALLAVPVAMCFRDTLEGDLKGEKLALLEAIGQLKGRLKVFYQKGKIKNPAEYNRLFALLEPCLHPIVPEGGVYSSFHPKLWLLRYTTDDSPMSAQKTLVLYRLLVLSRNLTFDRSWDIAVSLDGELGSHDSENTSNAQLTDFISSLLKQTDSFNPAESFQSELPNIHWHAPSGFWNPRLIPGGGLFGKPLELHSRNDALMVVSPFIKDAGGQVHGLDSLAELCPEGPRFLFSRAEELNAIGQEKLSGWECYSMNDAVVDGEERLEISNAKQNLHAKLIVTQRGNTSHWHLGSANATSAALGSHDDDVPRNTEFMLRLTGNTQKMGTDALKSQWLASESATESIFVPHEFINIDTDDHSDIAISIRKIVHQLITSQWRLRALPDDQNTFSLSIMISELPSIPDEIEVLIGQLAINNSYQPITSSLEWTGAHLMQISALVPIRIRASSQSEMQVLENLVIQADLEIPESFNREHQILADLINTEDKFYNYLRLLLQKTPDKNEWLEYDNVNGRSDGINLLFGDSPIFEQLMESAATHPVALTRISDLLQRIEVLGVPVPDDFKMLWRHFDKLVR